MITEINTIYILIMIKHYFELVKKLRSKDIKEAPYYRLNQLSWLNGVLEKTLLSESKVRNDINSLQLIKGLIKSTRRKILYWVLYLTFEWFSTT